MFGAFLLRIIVVSRYIVCVCPFPLFVQQHSEMVVGVVAIICRCDSTVEFRSFFCVPSNIEIVRHCIYLSTISRNADVTGCSVCFIGLLVAWFRSIWLRYHNIVVKVLWDRPIHGWILVDMYVDIERKWVFKQIKYCRFDLRFAFFCPFRLFISSLQITFR